VVVDEQSNEDDEEPSGVLGSIHDESRAAMPAYNLKQSQQQST
jgi:hypothetical protein